MTKKRQIGLLGGSFDPIHIGHLHLALEAKERFSFDEVLFCPNYLSPSKQKPSASAQDRLSMTKLAVEGIEGFSLLDYEIKKQGLSYTIDTVRFLKNSFPDKNYFLILGEDLLHSFMQWKEASELLKLAPIRIGTRKGGSPLNSTHFPPELQGSIQGSVFNMPHLEISSTELRERLSMRRYCQHLIPPKVVDYIERHGLYLTH